LEENIDLKTGWAMKKQGKRRTCFPVTGKSMSEGTHNTRNRPGELPR
jgi:hypothetical protein